MHPIWEKIISDYNFCNYDVDVQRVYKTYKLGSKQHSIAVILRELKDRLNLTNLLHYQKLQTYIMSLKMSCLDCPYLKIDFPKPYFCAYKKIQIDFCSGLHDLSML